MKDYFAEISTFATLGPNCGLLMFWGFIMSVDELDLLNFFGTLPEQLDPDEPWAYNDSVYEVADGHVQVSFAIAPFVKDVRVILKSNGILLYEMNALGIEDVKYHNDKGRESLEIIVSSRDSVWIRIKPQISIAQQISIAHKATEGK